MEPSEIETNFRLILQICEKNTTDISKLIQSQEMLNQSVNILAQVQLAQSRDVVRLTDYIAREEQQEIV